jgi:hypothetical protein
MTERTNREVALVRGGCRVEWVEMGKLRIVWRVMEQR